MNLFKIMPYIEIIIVILGINVGSFLSRDTADLDLGWFLLTGAVNV